MFPLEPAVPRPQLRLFRVGHADEEEAFGDVLAANFLCLVPVMHSLAGDAQRCRDRTCGHQIGGRGCKGGGHGIGFLILVDGKGITWYSFLTYEQILCLLHRIPRGRHY